MFDRPDIYLDAYNAVHLDVQRRTKKRTAKLKCRPGFEQRGSACQKISTKKPMKNNSGNGNNLAKAAAAIGLAGIIGGGVYLATRKKEELTLPPLPGVTPNPSKANFNKQIALGAAGLGVAGAGATALALKAKSKQPSASTPETPKAEDLFAQMGIADDDDLFNQLGIDKQLAIKGLYYHSRLEEANKSFDKGDYAMALEDYNAAIEYGEGKFETCEPLLKRAKIYHTSPGTAMLYGEVMRDPFNKKEPYKPAHDKVRTEYDKVIEQVEQYSVDREKKKEYLGAALLGKGFIDIDSSIGYDEPEDREHRKILYKSAVKNFEEALKVLGEKNKDNDSDEIKKMRNQAKENITSVSELVAMYEQK